MQFNEFELEQYFDKYEFSTPHTLSASDCESMPVAELLALEPGAQEEFLALPLGYTETRGDPELRALIASLYERLSPEDVLVLSGAEEGIFATLAVLLAEGGHVVCLWPAYQSLFELARSLPGCSLSTWELKDTGEGWTLDIDELEHLIRPDTRAVIVNTPNNPTGYTLSDDELSRIAAVCSEHGITLFADEVYRGLELAGTPRCAAADVYEKAVSLGVLSKAYGLPGLRIGWVATRDTELLRRIHGMRLYLTICNSAPSEFLAKVALRHGPELLERSRSVIRHNLDIAKMFFLEHGALFEAKPPACGPIAFHKLLLDMPVDAFCDRVRTERGVLLLPGSVYGVEGPYFRMGYGRRGFPEALMRLDDFIQKSGLAVKDEAAIFAALPTILGALSSL